MSVPPGWICSAARKPTSPRARRQLEHLVAGLELERVDHPDRDRHRRGGHAARPGRPSRAPARPSGRGSLCGSRRDRSCQLAPQQLARGGARELRRQLERLRDLVAREPLGAVRAQLGGGRRGLAAARSAPSPTRPTAGGRGRRRRPRPPAGCSSSTASTSAGATFSPPETIVSLLRPTTVRRPSSSRRPRSPVRSVSHSPTTVGPLTKISPSAAMLTPSPGSGRPAVSRSPGSASVTVEPASVSP